MAKKKSVKKTQKQKVFTEFENSLYLSECKRIALKGNGTPPAMQLLTDTLKNVDKFLITQDMEVKIKNFFNKENDKHLEKMRKSELSDSEEFLMEKEYIYTFLERISKLFCGDNPILSEILLISTEDNKKQNHADYVTYSNGFLYFQTIIGGGYDQDGTLLYTVVCNIKTGNFSVVPNNYKSLSGSIRALVKGLTDEIITTNSDVCTGIIPSLLKALIYLYEHKDGMIASAISNTKNNVIKLEKRGIDRKFIQATSKALLELEEDSYDQAIEQCLIHSMNIRENEYKVINSPFFISYQDTFNETDIVSLEKFNLDFLLLDSNEEAYEKFLDMPRYFDSIVIKISKKVSYHIEYVEEDKLLINNLEVTGNKQLIVATSVIVLTDMEPKIVTIMNNLKRKYQNLSKDAVILNGRQFNSGTFLLFNVIKLILFVYDKLNEARSYNQKKRDATIYIEDESSEVTDQNVKLPANPKDDNNSSLSRADKVKKVYKLDNIDHAINIVFKNKGISFNTARKPMRKHQVTGFWRHYKTGKKVWINPYTRGKSEHGKVQKEIHFKAKGEQ